MLHRILIGCTFIVMLSEKSSADIPAAGGQVGEAGPVGDKNNSNRFRERGGSSGIGISLAGAIALSLKENPELKSARQRLEGGKGRQMQADVSPNPSLDIDFENFGGTGAAKGMEGAETTVSLSQPIELGGKKAARLQIAVTENSILQNEYDALRASLVSSTTTSFIDLLAAQQQRSLNERRVDLAKEFEQTVERRVASGRGSPTEKIKSQVAVLSSIADLEKSESDLIAARIRLSSLWAGAGTPFENAEGDMSEMPTLPDLAELEKALFNNPMLSKRRNELAQTEAVLESEKAERVPDLNVKAGYRYWHDSKDKAFLIGISMPVPVFNQNSGSILEAKSNSLSAGFVLSSQEVELKSILAENYQIYLSSLGQAKKFRKTILKGADDALEASNDAYRLGRLEYLDVLDSQRTLFDIQSNYVNILSTLHKAVAEVQRLVGDKNVEIKLESNSRQ